VGGGDYDNRIKTIGASTVNGVALTSSWFSMSGGTDTMFRLTNEKGNTIAEGSASSLGISDPGSSEGQQAAIRALLARWSVGDVESLELQGRQAEADRLKISMSQTAEIDWTYILDPGKKIESDLSALGEAAGNAIKSGALSGSDAENLFGMAAELNKSRQKYAAEWATIGEDGGKALMDAILKQDWEKVGQLAGQKVGKSFVDSLTGAIHQVESKSIADILKGDLSEIGNMPGWIENTFNPALKTSFSEMYDVYKLGYDQNIQLGVDWVNEIETLYQKHSDWFEDWQAMILEQHATGYMTESQAIDAWKKYEDEAANKVESKQNQQIKQSGMFYGELVDQAAKWTDFINSEGGFVGPTALYDEFRAATDPNKALSADINTKYDIGSVGSIVRIEEAVKIDQTDPLMVHLESVSKEASDALNGPKVATHIEISTLHTTPIVNNSSPADETQQLVTNNPEASLSSVTADQPMVYTRTVKLDTTSARDEFDALKAAIENTDISARLTTSTATSAMNQPGSNISSVDQLGTQSQIGTASIAIKADTSGAKLTVDDLVNSINTAHPVMHVTVEIDANAAQIQIAVENAISAALASVRTY
jgi:hypothetical protein